MREDGCLRSPSVRSRAGWTAIMPAGLTAGSLCALVICCTSSSIETSLVRPGIEVLLSDSVHLVVGKRVGLLTNQTGVDSRGVGDVELLLDAGVELTALFSPEHGFSGSLDQPNIDHSQDSATGLPIYSLYGELRAPTSEMFDLIDVLLVDLQDIGARTYTYVAGALFTMEAAVDAEVPIVILDRPNPIGGQLVQGPMMDLRLSSDVGMLPIPLRHGMTMGELALLGNRKLNIGAVLTVVPAAGWRRNMWFDETGLPWVRPSLNMPDLESASHYPGTVLFEGTNLSVGRGTPIAFQVIGAPWLEPRLIAARVIGEPGVAIDDTVITPRNPSDGKYAEITLPALRFRVTDRDIYDPTRLAVLLLAAIKKRYPDSFEIRSARYFDNRAGSAVLRQRLEAGEHPVFIFETWLAELTDFVQERESFLIYR